MVNPLRIDFAEAITEPRLLQQRFGELSVPQQVILKIIYGCELTDAIPDNPTAMGFSELEHWAFLQEHGQFDSLGFPVSTTGFDYAPKTYHEAWVVSGIRAGKSDAIAATIIAYEATCGGHEAFLRKGRQAVCFQIAQDLRLARYSLHSLRATLESMPFIMTPWGKSDSRITNVTADKIELWNGMIISTIPPTVKSIRGYDAPVAVLDEVGVWYQESDSANPDYEIYRAVSSRQAQFPDRMIVGISSPWNKGGMLYQRYEAGTDGLKLRCGKCLDPTGCPACAELRRPHQGRLVLYGTSASLGNPLVASDWLVAEQAKDPTAFARECLAEFQDSISGFLDGKLLRESVDSGIVEREPDPSRVYIAAMDPAFRRDSFGFAIGHADQDKGIVVDVVRKYQPQLGQPPLNPDAILATEIVPLLKQFKVTLAYSDQHHFDSLNQLALQHGFALECVPFSAQSKADIYGNLKQLVNSKRFRMVDHPEAVRELASLELKLSEAGGVQIAAPKGQHDDLATVVALMAHKAIWMLPAQTKAAPKPLKPTELAFQQVARKRFIVANPAWD